MIPHCVKVYNVVLLTGRVGWDILCPEVICMKKLIAVIIAMLIIAACAFAEENVPHFEKYGAEVLYVDEAGVVTLDDGIVFFNDTEVNLYPCNISYEVTRDDVFGGKRYLNVRVHAVLDEMPELTAGTMATMFYALHDYYTGRRLDIDTIMYDRAIDMYDFTIEYGENSWDVKAGLLVNVYYPDNGVEFEFNYQLIMDEDYDGIVFCNEPVFEYTDAADFAMKMEHHHAEDSESAESAGAGDEHVNDEAELIVYFPGVYARVKPVGAAE